MITTNLDRSQTAILVPYSRGLNRKPLALRPLLDVPLASTLKCHLNFSVHVICFKQFVDTLCMMYNIHIATYHHHQHLLFQEDG